MQRPIVLYLGGLDPSAGAGLLADIKTCEAHQVYGFGVCTGLTVQNDIHFEGIQWVPLSGILAQVDLLYQRFKFDFVKIGLIENIPVLLKVVRYLRSKRKAVKIIWDPILSASAGFVFHRPIPLQLVDALTPHLYLITPNWPEMATLGATEDPWTAACQLSQRCCVLLKGGHNRANPGTDWLFVDQSAWKFETEATVLAGKHGSGCVLAASIIANLALEYSLQKACARSKAYITDFLNSTSHLLGYHITLPNESAH